MLIPELTLYWAGEKNLFKHLLTIGTKRGGTREQCSQKLFELAEIFRKIVSIASNRSKINILFYLLVKRYLYLYIKK